VLSMSREESKDDKQRYVETETSHNYINLMTIKMNGPSDLGITPSRIRIRKESSCYTEICSAGYMQYYKVFIFGIKSYLYCILNISHTCA